MERETNYPETFDEPAERPSRDDVSDPFSQETYEVYPRYRNIPVRRIPERMNLTPSRRENASGMREIQRAKMAPSESPGDPSSVVLKSPVQSSGHQKSPGELFSDHQKSSGELFSDHQKPSGELFSDHQKPSGEFFSGHQKPSGEFFSDHQKSPGEFFSDHQKSSGELFSGERPSRAEKAAQNSRSEPMIEIKDRGDATDAFELEYEEDASARGSEFGDAINPKSGYPSSEFGYPTPPDKGGLKGYVLLKSGGKIYRSRVSADEVKSPEKSWDLHWKEFASRACGDFDVAIFLTGLERPPGVQSRSRKDSVSPVARTVKRYKPRYEVEQTTVRPSLGRSLESTHDRYIKLKHSFSGGYPEKEQHHHRAKQPSFSFSPDRMSFYRMMSSQLNKDAESAMSSASESESVHRAPRNLVRSKLLQEPIVINERILPRERFGKRRLGTYNSKSSDASQTSLMYRQLAQAKIGDVELFAVFEDIFRRYSSTSRHAGDVISKSISTDWMVNAGVVGDYLTRKEADETFKKAAGAKITMNSMEYKEFLIKLTQRLKLPYYEIYHRMCGIEG